MQGRIKRRIINLCKELVRPQRIVAIMLYGPRVSGYGGPDGHVEVLLILSWKRPGIGFRLRQVDGVDVHVLMVDRRLVQWDARWGLLGDCLAGRLFTPYVPLVGVERLWELEVLLKRRIVLEALERLLWDYVEIAHELRIHPRYFLHEYMARRAAIYPLSAYEYANIQRKDVKERNLNAMMVGFMEALRELEEEGWVRLQGGYVRIGKRLMGKRSWSRLPRVVRAAYRSAATHLMGLLPWVIRHHLNELSIHMRALRTLNVRSVLPELEDPRDYLYLPTSTGMVPLSDGTTVDEFVRKIAPAGCKVDVRRIGWLLASTYLITIRGDGWLRRVVVKKFADEKGLKWIPVSLWALGARRFAMLGDARLRREYAATRLLRRHGIPAPDILHVSPRSLLIFKEYVEGENLVKLIKRAAARGKPTEDEMETMRGVGRRIAEIHRLGVTLGDCKPENILISRSGEVYLVDLEQAMVGGDEAWDLAEFIYLLAFYAPTSPKPPFLPPSEVLAQLAREFLVGYLEGGGSMSVVKRVLSPRYGRVFGVLVPHSAGVMTLLRGSMEASK